MYYARLTVMLPELNLIWSELATVRLELKAPPAIKLPDIQTIDFNTRLGLQLNDPSWSELGMVSLSYLPIF